MTPLTDKLRALLAEQEAAIADHDPLACLEAVGGVFDLIAASLPEIEQGERAREFAQALADRDDSIGDDARTALGGPDAK